MGDIMLYGLEGADKNYRAACYWHIFKDDVTVANIMYQANILRMRYPGVKAIYMIDNHDGLKRSYMDSWNMKSIEHCAIFKDLLQRYGYKLI